MRKILRNKFWILGLVVISIIFFVSRMALLTKLPIFTDEAIYIRWSQIALHDSNWRFISLTDGKQPLFTWFMMIALKFIHDPLAAGRFTSVIGGFFTMTGLFLLGREVFRSKRIGFIASLLYLLYPFALVYDRMALYDTWVGTFAVWGLLFSVLLVRYVRLDTSLLLGIIGGFGVLTKSSGFFTAYLLPFSLLLFNPRKENVTQRFFRWVGLAIVSVIMIYGMYQILRLSPFYHIIDEKTANFVYPLSEWLRHPLTYFVGNFMGLSSWFVSYMTIPFIIAAIFPFVIYKKFLKEKIYLFVWFGIQFIVLALFGRVLYPRYIFFMTISLLPLVAYTIDYLLLLKKRKWIFAAVSIILAVFWLWSDYFILFDFARAPIADSDVGQYFTHWPAGVGVKESVAFFKQQAQNQKIYIATEGTFGLMPFSLEMYLVDNPNVILKGVWPIEDKPPKDVVNHIDKMPTYFLFYQPCPSCTSTYAAPSTWNVSPILRFKREDGTYLTVYQMQK